MHAPRQNSRIAALRGTLLPPVLGTLLLLCAFVHFETFAREDDYSQLQLAVWEHTSWWTNTMAQEGRLLYGWIILAGWKVLGSIDQAIWFRFAGIAGVVGLMWMLHGFIVRRLGLSPWAATALAGWAVCTPAVTVYTYWAATAPFAWSALVAVGAAWWFCAVQERSRDRVYYFSLGGITALLFVAELIYQPTAGFFLVPMVLLVALRGSSADRRVAFLGLIQLGAVMLAYYIFYKVASATIWTNAHRTGRAGELVEVGANLRHFLLQVTPMLAKGWSVFAGRDAALAVQSATVAAILLWLVFQFRRWHGKGALINLGLVIACFLASAAPVFVSGKWSPYRTLSAPSAVLAIVLAVGLARILPRRGAVRPAAGWLAILVTAWAARHSVTKYVVNLHVEERQRLLEHIRALPDGFPPVVTVATSRLPGILPAGARGVYDYGNSNSSNPWFAVAMVKVVMAEELGVSRAPADRERFPDRVYFESMPTEAVDTWYHGHLVDFRVLLGQEPSTQLRSDELDTELGADTAPVLGTVMRSRSGWVRHATLGWMYFKYRTWAFSEDFGWIHPYQAFDGGCWIESPFFGRFAVHWSEWPEVENEEGERFDLPARARQLDRELFGASREPVDREP